MKKTYKAEVLYKMCKIQNEQAMKKSTELVYAQLGLMLGCFIKRPINE